jgi:hypothetical protein
MKRLILALAMVVMVSPAWGGAFDTGNRLYEKCSTEKTSPTYYQNMDYCLAYVVGIVDAVNGADRGIDGYKICVPDSANRGQAADIVLAWLTKSPEKRHLSASTHVMYALHKAWPCP